MAAHYAEFRDNQSTLQLFILNIRREKLLRVVQQPMEGLLMIDLRTAPYAAFVLRVALGVMFIAHALLKYYVFTLPGTVKFFESIGLPGPLAYLTFWAELIGGTLILAGAWSRWAAAALVPLLIGATWAHAGNGWLFSAANGG